MDFSFVDARTIFVIVHLLGLALGVGAAYMTDFIFMVSSQDKVITKDEYRMLTLGSRIVWIGLALLFVSGVGLFMFDPERLLASTKFQSKITILIILIVNGALFHFKHMPIVKGKIGKNLSTSITFRNYGPYLYMSGAVSVTSWTSVLVLGSFRSIPWSYTQIMTTYGVVLIFALIGASFVRKQFFKKRPRSRR